MGKSHKRLEKVADAFTTEVAARFPGVEQEVSFEERGGYEVWVWVFLPVELMTRYWQIEEEISEIIERLIEETGVNIIAGVRTRNPELVPARGK